MAYCEKATVTLTLTGGATTGTAYSPVINGRLVSIRYIPAASGTKFEGSGGNFDLTTTLESSGTTIWTETGITAAKTVRPTGAVADDAGVADPTTRDAFFICNERLSFAVANSDANASGSWQVIIEGSFKGA